MSRCEGCPFQTCPVIKASEATGHHRWMIVGEAPGAEEIPQGTPFVGPSGQLLWRQLNAVGGPSREECFVTNALSCRAPQGKITPSAIRACADRVHEEILKVQPELILALGNKAVSSLTNDPDPKITQIRGRIIQTTYGPILPTLHPAAILRNPADSKKFTADLKYFAELTKAARGELETVKRDPGMTKYAVVNDDTVEKAVQGLLTCDLIGADIETTGFDPVKDEMLCIALAWAPNKVLIFPTVYIDELKPVFESKKCRLVWHNGKFDTTFLRARGLPARIDEDVMLMHYALDEVKGTHDLGQVAGLFLGAPDYKAESDNLMKGKKKADRSYANLPIGVLYRRVSKDADYTRQLYNTLLPMIQEKRGLEPLYRRILLPASDFLQTIERAGFYVNTDAIDALDNELTLKQQELQRKMDLTLDRYGIRGVNYNSPIQLKPIIYQTLRQKPAKGYKMDTREETLRNLKPGHSFIELLLQHRETAKQLSTYVHGIQEQIEDGDRVRSSYLIHGTVTGRLSSRDPNMQNIPRDKSIRGIFQAAPGKVLVEVDYASAELRVLAMLSKDKFLSEIFQQGRKLHHEVAVEMYGENYSKDEYIRAKAVNFGIAYGRTEYSLALEYKIPVSEAKEMIRMWFARMPQAETYINMCRQAPLQGKILISPFGRRRRFGLINEVNRDAVQNEAANFPISSTATDCTLLSGIAVQPMLKEKYDADIVNIIHDSIVAETEPQHVNHVAALILWTMRKIPDRYLHSAVPFDGEVKVGKVWGSLEDYTVPEEYLVHLDQTMAMST